MKHRDQLEVLVPEVIQEQQLPEAVPTMATMDQLDHQQGQLEAQRNLQGPHDQQQRVPRVQSHDLEGRHITDQVRQVLAQQQPDLVVVPQDRLEAVELFEEINCLSSTFTLYNKIYT